MLDWLLKNYIRSLGFDVDEIANLPGHCVGFSARGNHYVLVLEPSASGNIEPELFYIDYTKYNLDCKGEYLYFYRGEYRKEHSCLKL